MRTWVTAMRWIAEFSCWSPLPYSQCRVVRPSLVADTLNHVIARMRCMTETGSASFPSGESG